MLPRGGPQCPPHPACAYLDGRVRVLTVRCAAGGGTRRQACYKYNNYNAVVALARGLAAPPVQRLRSTWAVRRPYIERLFLFSSSPIDAARLLVYLCLCGQFLGRPQDRELAVAWTMARTLLDPREGGRHAAVYLHTAPSVPCIGTMGVRLGTASAAMLRRGGAGGTQPWRCSTLWLYNER
jgi:hypothetical protein